MTLFPNGRVSDLLGGSGTASSTCCEERYVQLFSLVFFITSRFSFTQLEAFLSSQAKGDAETKKQMYVSMGLLKPKSPAR
jgi:hypothetical protein